MKPKEMPLAGYLLARAAMHKQVDGSALHNLRAGHESVKQVNDLLPFGRANVIEDIEKAKDRHPDLYLRHESTVEYRNGLRVMQLYSQMRSRGSAPMEGYHHRMYAASSQYAGTGVCTSYNTSTTPLHAAKLADMKDKRAIVAQANHQTIDHNWSEMIPKGMREDGTLILDGKDVIMDGWCKENLAVLREDSYFARLDANGKADHLKHEGFLNHETGPKALREVEKFKKQIKNSRGLQETYNEYFLERFQYPKVDSHTFGLWNDTTVFHADFLERAGNALHKEVKEVKDTEDIRKAGKHAEVAEDSRKQNVVRNLAEQTKHASLAEIQAIGVARSLGSNIRDAITEAPGITAAAKEMFPRPTRKE
ncbi:MAG TPA: hypothetical protein VK465_10975 [Fibrobacteria bacterium]|nr:hypothetical protein [Fibrobacteria bacterium]